MLVVLALVIPTITISSIFVLSDRVQTDVIESEIDGLFVAIETGPLEFARLQSAAIANELLEKLMDSSSNRNAIYRSARIDGGPNFEQKYAVWGDDDPILDSDSCIVERERFFSKPEDYYSYRVSVSVNFCQRFAPLVEIEANILRVITFTFVAIFICLLVFSLPVSYSLRVMEKIFKDNSQSSDLMLSRIIYEPLKHVTELAINSRNSEKKLAVANIVSHLAHDLRGPLGTFERLLSLSPNDFDGMKNSIQESLNRMHSMIEALRHTETEVFIKPFLSKIQFNLLIDQLKSKAEEKNIDIYSNHELIDNVWVDSPKIERVFVNLISNAIDAARSLVHIEVELRDRDLFVSVKDDGSGVPIDREKLLFKRGATFGKENGTGLGLAYVKQVMMGHGGDVRYYRENNLTVFECFIPNAFESKPMPTIEKAHVEPEIKEPLRRNIGIAFRSPSRCSEILDRLNGIKAETMQWHEGFDQGYDFIITDDPGIVDKCIDEGISVAQFKPDTPASEIVRRTLIRLGIREIEREEDV